MICYFPFYSTPQLQSLLKIQEHLSQSGIRIEWTNVKKLHDVLEPLERLTRKLQAEQYLAGDLMFDLYDCQMQLRSMSRRNPELRTMVDDMLEKIAHRAKLITKNIQFAAALYMDPRFVHRTMGINYLTPDQQLEIVVCTNLI